jgi:hypothetical protein
MNITRRHMIIGSGALATLPRPAFAALPREITWDDLIPDGVPYAEIISEGDRDEERDTWSPIFDENAMKLNDDLKDTIVKIPGYIVPLDLTLSGLTSFVLVPYVGACIHTPPPPPNQLIYVTTDIPWTQDNMWDAVWITGLLGHETTSTDVAETGYTLSAQKIEIYEW